MENILYPDAPTKRARMALLVRTCFFLSFFSELCQERWIPFSGSKGGSRKLRCRAQKSWRTLISPKSKPSGPGWRCWSGLPHAGALGPLFEKLVPTKRAQVALLVRTCFFLSSFSELCQERLPPFSDLASSLKIFKKSFQPPCSGLTCFPIVPTKRARVARRG